jgi:hypothetical protein
MNKIAIFLLVLPLSACVTVVGFPVEGTMSMVVSGVSELMADSAAEDPPCALRNPLPLICIEYNRDVAIPDFVPALQNRFKQLQVESALYAPGTMPSACRTTLRYSTSRGWKARFSSDEMQPYLIEADLALLEEGKVISNARYQISGMGYEKWTSTAAKMSPVVDALVCKDKLKL